MAAPNSRESLIEYAQRSLGHPVITINVDNEQCEDRLDEALQFFAEYHFDGAEKAFFRYQLTSQDITNKYIDLNNYHNEITEEEHTKILNSMPYKKNMYADHFSFLTKLNQSIHPLHELLPIF